MARPYGALSGLLALLIFSLGCFWLAGTARAEPYAPPEAPGGETEPSLAASGRCPAPPGAYEGTDATVAELRLLRSESDEACAALAERTDEVLHRLWWLVAEGAVAHAQRGTATEKLEAIAGELSPPVAVSLSGQPIEVTGSAVGSEGTAQIVASVDAGAEASKLALWVIVGVLVGLIVAFAIWRTGALRG